MYSFLKAFLVLISVFVLTIQTQLILKLTYYCKGRSI